MAAAAASWWARLALGVAVFGGDGVDRVGQLAGAERPAPAARRPTRATGELDAAGAVAGGRRAATGSTCTGSTWMPTAGALRADPAQRPAPRPAAPPPRRRRDRRRRAGPAAPTADGARVVKTGAIALIVEDGQVTPTLTEVQQARASRRRRVSAAKTAGDRRRRRPGSVTLRVPVDAFEEVVAQVRGLGAEVRSATTRGKDVTAQYADLEAQLRTLKAARERFLEILSDARTIGDVLAVQQRVDDVTGQIDRLEGQRRVLAAQSDSATLEVTVTEDDDPVVMEAEEPDDGIVARPSRDAWDGFTSGRRGAGAPERAGAAAAALPRRGLRSSLRLGWRASRRRLV